MKNKNVQKNQWQDAFNVEARHVLGVAAQQDVGAAPRHVGRDRHGAAAAGLGDDLGLALHVLGLGVEDLVCVCCVSVCCVSVC